MTSPALPRPSPGQRRASRELSMDFVLQLLFQGIAIGSVYALVALGFVLIFRATNVVNFAQGEFSMVAAFLMVACAVDLGWPYWLSFLIALAGMALLGAVFNLGVYYPLRHRTYLPVIISTIGASILMTNSTLAIYGPQPQNLPGWFDTPGFQARRRLSRQPVSPDHCRNGHAGRIPILVLRAHAARQETASDEPG